jgi:hypothetical protein
MSDQAFLARLATAVQASHEATMHLQQLATELIDHCARMRSFADRLHVIRQEIAPPSEEALNLPRILQNGPVVRER